MHSPTERYTSSGRSSYHRAGVGADLSRWVSVSFDGCASLIEPEWSTISHLDEQENKSLVDSQGRLFSLASGYTAKSGS